MIQTIRRHLFGLAARVSICFALVTGFSVRADAQFMTEDPPVLAQSIIKWIDDQLANGDQLVQLIDQLATAKSSLEEFKILYKEVKSYINEGQTYWNLLTSVERLKYDAEALAAYYNGMIETGHFSIARARAVTRLAGQLVVDYKDFRTLFEALFKKDNSLSQADRLKLATELEESINDMSRSLESIMLIDAESTLDEMTVEGEFAILESALFGDADEADVAAIDLDLDSIMDDVIASINKGQSASETVSVEDPVVSKTTVDSIFGLASVLIGVLAALMIPWGYARYVKTGERQHQDALWKVFAGLIFVLLLLQVVKAVLFDSGFVNLG